ncbi:MAG: hypothetical protein Q9216_003167 [Gyalolechia sp. 2 TL-2023]
MSLPGHDGYRTPTVDDYERRNGEAVERDRGEEKLPTNVTKADRSKHDHFRLEKLHWRERIRHYTWTFFTMTMATGGIANVLYTGLFRASYMHPSERLFLPAAVVSFGTVLINISQYGLTETGPWLGRAVVVMFWIYAALAILSSSGIYLLMWSTQSFTVEQMTPIWIFPAYPMLLIGPYASILCKSLSREESLDITVAGFTIQGIGFLVAFMIYASFIYRLMTQKLPQQSSRPGMFVSVGPSGFTVAGVIGMADSLSRNVDDDFMGDGQMAAMILRVMANWMCLWIWGLAFWFFLVSVGAHWSCAKSQKGFAFGMTWFSFIFPNTALITATFAVGKAFQSRGIQITGCVMTVFLLITWFAVMGMMFRAIKLKHILWPQTGEDKDEGGFKAPVTLERRETLKQKLSKTMSSRSATGQRSNA